MGEYGVKKSFGIHIYIICRLERWLLSPCWWMMSSGSSRRLGLGKKTTCPFSDFDPSRIDMIICVLSLFYIYYTYLCTDI